MTSNLANPTIPSTRTGTPSVTRVGIGIAALLAIGDIVGGISNLAPGSLLPPEIALTAVVLGVGTVILVPFAWRRAVWSIWLIAALRALSALTALPAFFVSGVPTGAVLAAAASIIVTVVAVVLLLVKGQRG